MRTPRKGKRRVSRIIGLSKILTDDEIARLTDYLHGRRRGRGGSCVKIDSENAVKIAVMCDLFLNSGLRCQELCGLKLKNLPCVLGDNVIEVRGKGGKERMVPISARLARRLEDYIKKQRCRTVPRYIKKSDVNGRLFYNQQNRKFTPNAVYKRVRKAGEKSGIVKRLHPHMFRHTYATNLLAKGESIHHVKEVMGHGDITITMLYLHLIPGRLRGLGDRGDCAFV